VAVLVLHDEARAVVVDGPRCGKCVGRCRHKPLKHEEEPGRQAAANLMTRDEARRIAANIAKAAGAAAKVLNEVFLKALPLLIELRTNRFTGNIDVMGRFC
jgi:hypothetical protein